MRAAYFHYEVLPYVTYQRYRASVLVSLVSSVSNHRSGNRHLRFKVSTIFMLSFPTKEMKNEQKQQNVSWTNNRMSTEGEGRGLEGVGIPLPVNFHGNLKSAQNDQHFKELLQQAKESKQTAVVSYGAKWCNACRQMLPTFCNLSNDYPNSLFIYTDIDECPDETLDVRYTPTFRFFRGGEKVDEFYGAGPQRLRDRVWLQS